MGAGLGLMFALAALAAVFAGVRTHYTSRATTSASMSTTVLTGDAALRAAQAQPVRAGVVPFVVGLTQAQARERLARAGYDLVVIGNADQADTDRVMDVSPQPGTHAGATTPVVLTLGVSGNSAD